MCSVGVMDAQSKCPTCHSVVPICRLFPFRFPEKQMLKGEGENNVMFSIALNPFLASCKI